ncbi:MAG: hypothetical protein WAV20_18205 [Blastocatellia bacterium]
MKRNIQIVVSVVLALGVSQSMWLTASAQMQEGGTSKGLATTGRLLVSASKLARVKVHSEEVFSIARGTEALAVAPVAGWERIPATQMRNGVNIAFAYFDTKEPKVRRGYYTLKAYANVTEVGTVDARVELIDRSGRVAGEIPAQAEIHSLTVPPEAASRRTFVTTATAVQTPINPNRPRIWFRCPNGVCIIVGVFTDTRIL